MSLRGRTSVLALLLALAPGWVIANLAFVDEQGFAVLDRNYQPLQIEVPLVRTP